MKYRIILLVIGLALSTVAFSQTAQSGSVRVAIVDQLMSQKLSSIDYANDYMKGIETAVKAAKNKFGLMVVVKHFSYGKGYLGPIPIIQNIKQWLPDFIIGPRSSTNFLLLEPFFKNILVISPVATADKVYRMPSNFYSMSMPDKYVANAIASFASKQFPDSKGALIIDAADCLSCHAIARHIEQYYKQHEKRKRIIMRSFIGNNVETVDIKKLTNGWSKGYVIYSPNISYVSGVLITRIANFLAEKNLIFLGGDEWGQHEVGYIGQLKTKYPFSAYHLQDWSFIHSAIDSDVFQSFYTVIYKKKPEDPVSYASFHALYSVLSLLNKTEIRRQTNKSKYILNAFLAYKKQHNDAFRQKLYVIYKWDHQSNKDVISDTVSARLK